MSSPPPPAHVEPAFAALWRRFRLGGELRPLVCLVVTLAIALVLGGLGLGLGWLRGMFRVSPGRLGIRGDVREHDLIVGLVVAGVAWVALLFWVWRPAVRLERNSWSVERRRQWVTPIAACALIGALLTVLTYAVGRRPWDDREYLVTALTLVAAGAALLTWLPIVFEIERGRPVLRSGGSVNVSCADCGYSMVGLRETTCPECGREYTIDELILVQGYEGEPPPPTP